MSSATPQGPTPRYPQPDAARRIAKASSDQMVAQAAWTLARTANCPAHKPPPPETQPEIDSVSHPAMPHKCRFALPVETNDSKQGKENVGRPEERKATGASSAAWCRAW